MVDEITLKILEALVELFGITGMKVGYSLQGEHALENGDIVGDIGQDLKGLIDMVICILWHWLSKSISRKRRPPCYLGTLNLSHELTSS